MKLKRYTPEYLKFWHNKEEIDIPEYKYRENDVRGCWISNVVNIAIYRKALWHLQSFF